ncbi:macrophage mannose receptor 1-like, partial [Ciona intestinalis]
MERLIWIVLLLFSTTVASDYCVPNPCMNGGECNDGETTFECRCLPGTEGNICEITVCSDYPCHNGGSCRITEAEPTCDCYEGYYGDHCQINTTIHHNGYEIQLFQNNRQIYSNAKTSCEKEKGNLVIIRDIEIQESINEKLLEIGFLWEGVDGGGWGGPLRIGTNIIVHSRYWGGGCTNNGGWVWGDGAPLPTQDQPTVGAYSNWKAGEPNEKRNAGLQILPIDSINGEVGLLGTWVDNSRNELKYFICQKKFPIIHEGNEILFRNLRKNFNNARMACEDEKGGLLIVKDEITQKLVEKYLGLWVGEWEGVNWGSKFHHGYWIGANNVGEWRWLDGTAVPMTGSDGYSNWLVNEPNNGGNAALAMLPMDDMVDGVATMGMWADSVASQEKYYICQKSLCADTPCMHEGTCSTTDTGYVCNCSEDYYGDRCEVEYGK